MTKKPETQVVHSTAVDPSTGAIAPPIVLSTTFERGIAGDYPHGYIYNRTDNPNRQALEQTMCQLEGGTVAYAVSSGSAAMMSLFQALQPGDHIVSGEDLYYGIRVLLNEIFVRWGVGITYVDMRDVDAVKAAMTPHTKLVILESPSNPMIRLADIATLAEVSHQHNALLVVDNTAATPIAQTPLVLGADIVVHAMTKYIAGHSDVLSGIIISREQTPFMEHIGRIIHIGGAVPDPMGCWLTLRGLQTLPYRMRGHAENALKIAEYLSEHPKVEAVLYPQHPSHPQHNLARQQMRLGSGLMSILIRGGQGEAIAVTNKVKLFIRATSFGGTHSLIEHRASVEENSTTPTNLLRLSVGLEHADDLIADLAQALE